jgi:hypothetical protein
MSETSTAHKGAGRRIYGWIDDRFNVSPLFEFMRHKQVPVHRHTMWYYMGGVTLFLFIVQVATGILLVLYYKPGADSAYESVRFITTKVQFGWLIRSVHNRSANVMVFFAFVHMFSTFFTRSYNRPRELTWVSGFLLLAISLGFGFTGYLLPWNELAYFATKVGTDIVGAVPLVGEPLKILMRGGEDVTGGPVLCDPHRHPAGHYDDAVGRPPPVRAAPGNARADVRGKAAGRQENEHAVLSQFSFAGYASVADRIEFTAVPRRVLSMGTGRKSGHVYPGAGGNQARVVLHVHVSDVETAARTRVVYRGRDPGNRGLRFDRTRVDAGAVLGEKTPPAKKGFIHDGTRRYRHRFHFDHDHMGLCRLKLVLE